MFIRMYSVRFLEEVVLALRDAASRSSVDDFCYLES